MKDLQFQLFYNYHNPHLLQNLSEIPTGEPESEKGKNPITTDI